MEGAAIAIVASALMVLDPVGAYLCGPCGNGTPRLEDASRDAGPRPTHQRPLRVLSHLGAFLNRRESATKLNRFRWSWGAGPLADNGPAVFECRRRVGPLPTHGLAV